MARSRVELFEQIRRDWRAGGSSIRELADRHHVHRRTVQTEGVDRIDFMWLDMEGMELSALKAAGPVFATVKAVCMEISREEDRVGVPLYGEVVTWMRDQGFRAAIDRVTLWFGNILFVRD